MSKQNRIFVTLLIILSLFAFSYGTLSTYYQFFPFHQLVFITNYFNRKPVQDNILTEYPHYKDRISLFKLFTSTAKNVMIGDSITEYTEWGELFPTSAVLNRGIGSDTTYGVLKRLDSIINTKADNAFIMLGINDIAKNRSVENICEDYIQIITILEQNNVQPIIQSTLYVSTKYTPPLNKPIGEINSDVERLNTRLEQYCKRNNIVFINLNDELSENMTLKEEFTNDGVHLNGDGYNIWKRKISNLLH